MEVTAKKPLGSPFEVSLFFVESKKPEASGWGGKSISTVCSAAGNLCLCSCPFLPGHSFSSLTASPHLSEGPIAPSQPGSEVLLLDKGESQEYAGNGLLCYRMPCAGMCNIVFSGHSTASLASD